MLTRKHFRKIAKMLKNWEVCPAFIQDMAHLLEEENPRFDRLKFLEACGIELKGGRQ